MARRFGILALIVVLGGVAFWATRQDEPPVPEGQLAVRVHVIRDGKPVGGAQVRPRFSQEPWANVDGAGNITLPDVPLNAGKTPTRASLGAAIAVRARFLGVRSNPLVRREGDYWHATFELTPHGVIRLSIEDTHLAPVKAWIEPDPKGRVEAMGGQNVARLDQPVAFRVLPGLKELVVRVEGEADPLGVIRACTQRLVFPAPGPGVIKQVYVRPQPAQPIAGTARTADPDGGSVEVVGDGIQVVVHEMENETPTYELGRVNVGEQGDFFIPFTGRGPYALSLHIPQRAPGPMTVAGGNTDVMVFGGRLLPFVRFEHRELDPKRRHLSLQAEGADGTPVQVAGVLHRERSWSRLTLKETPGTLRVRASVPGTQKEPPLEGTQSVEVPRAGETIAQLLLDPAPFGTVAFEVVPIAVAYGSVTLGERKTTLIPNSTKPAHLKHVHARAGIPLSVHWTNVGTDQVARALHLATVDVRDGETLAVEVPFVEGGFVTWDGVEAYEPTLRLPAGQTPYGAVTGAVAFVWRQEQWRSEHALKPGTYRATIDDVAVQFEIQAGQTVRAIPAE